MTDGVVSALHLHPIKSCHRIDVDMATVGPTGLVDDREWQLSTPANGPLTQRQRAALATVRPEPVPGGLRISAPGHPTIEVARPTGADTTTTALIGIETGVGDAGDEAARWFSAVVGDEVRLVALVDAPVELPPALDLFDQAISFGDLAPVLVATTASLDWLVERATEPFTMERFRPNIVVTTDEPFAEDTWARFRLGGAELVGAMPWPRCSIPQVDQEDGARHREPAVVLKRHRWCSHAPSVLAGFRPILENSGIFGVGCGVGPVGAEIAVGDRLEVLETAEPLLANPALG